MDERIGLILDVNGAEDLLQANVKVRDLSREFANLQSIINRGAPGWELARQRIDSVRNALEQARTAADRAKQSYSQALGAGGSMMVQPGGGAVPAGGKGAAAGGWMAQNAANLSMGFFQLGALVEDAQYGFRAVANNLPMLAMNIAGMIPVLRPFAMAVGGFTAIATTAGYQLSRMSFNTSDGNKPIGQTVLTTQAKSIEERAKQLAFENNPKYASAVQSQFGGGKAREFATQLTDSRPLDLTPEENNAIWHQKQFRHNARFSPERTRQIDNEIARIEQGARERAIRETISLIAGAEYDPGKLNAVASLKDQMGDSKGANALRRALQPQGFNAGITSRVIADAGQMSDEAAFKSLIGEQERLQRAVDNGSISVADFNDLMSRVQEAMELASDKARGLTQETLDLAEAEQKLADKRQEAKRKIVQDQNTTAAERMSGQAAGLYGQAYGGQIAGAMQRAALRGEDDGAVNERLQTQLESRMRNLPPSLRSMAARQVIEQARMQQQGMAIMGAAAGDIGGAMAESQMAPANTRLGIMQRQFAARQGGGLAPANSRMGIMQRQFMAKQGISAEQFMGPQAAMPVQEPPEVKQMKAGEKMDSAADKLVAFADRVEKGITVRV